MKIYIAHSNSFDFHKELYKPIRENLTDFNILLPHEKNRNEYQNRDFYKNIQIFIAEVSFPSTGMGIELGYADDDKIPIYCIYKKGFKYSSSISTITKNFYEYSNENELIEIIRKIINLHHK